MLYSLLKSLARIAIRIYCKSLRMNTREFLDEKGPLLLAVNHPDSFLDAIILSTLFNAPIHSLARGDAFKNPKANRFLRSIHMLPVYRLREGAENLQENYSTFAACREIFKQNGIVLIFSEGLCENEWHLRPLMKGTARLVTSSWDEGISLRVLPIGMNYHSFRDFGKITDINFGEIFTEKDIPEAANPGEKLNLFNRKLEVELQPLVYEIDPGNVSALKKTFPDTTSPAVKICLAIPALAGWLLHAPFYFPVKKFALEKFGRTGHYDSVLVGLLFFLYPFYLLLIAVLAGLFLSPIYGCLALLMPFLAFCFIQFKTPGYAFDFKRSRHKKKPPLKVALP